MAAVSYLLEWMVSVDIEGVVDDCLVGVGEMRLWVVMVMDCALLR